MLIATSYGLASSPSISFSRAEPLRGSDSILAVTRHCIISLCTGDPSRERLPPHHTHDCRMVLTRHVGDRQQIIRHCRFAYLRFPTTPPRTWVARGRTYQIWSPPTVLKTSHGFSRSYSRVTKTHKRRKSILDFLGGSSASSITSTGMINSPFRKFDPPKWVEDHERKGCVECGTNFKFTRSEGIRIILNIEIEFP